MSLPAIGLYQEPPTPTPLPAGDNRGITALESYSIWESTDQAITAYNMYPEAGYIVQVILLGAIVLMAVRTVWGYFNKMIGGDEIS